MSQQLSLENAVLIAFFTMVFTFFSNLILQWLKNRIDWFDDNKKFLRDHSYNQLKELYLELYGVVVQSEFLRKFQAKSAFQQVPFIEVQKWRTIISFTDDKSEDGDYKIIDSITEFNKIGIVNRVMNKKEFASQKLLKLIVSYRYVHDNYLNKSMDPEWLKKYQEQEVQLIAEIVKTIVIECNQKLKMCKMNYDSKEKTTGLMSMDFIVDSNSK